MRRVVPAQGQRRTHRRSAPWGLTWFRRTMVADGTGEEEAGGGLTRFGRAVVRPGLPIENARQRPLAWIWDESPAFNR